MQTSITTNVRQVERQMGRLQGAVRPALSEALDTVARESRDALYAAVYRRTPVGRGPMTARRRPAARLRDTTQATISGTGMERTVTVQQTAEVLGRRWWLLSGIIVHGHQQVTSSGQVVGFVPGRDYMAQAKRDADPAIRQSMQRVNRTLGGRIVRTR